MNKKTFIQLILCFSISLVSWSVDAHQPVLSSESVNTTKTPYIIEGPGISKAIFSELKGEPHYYLIDSDAKFRFFAGITVPNIDGCPLVKSFPSKSLILISDLSNGKMVKNLTGSLGMKNMEKSSTGSDQKLEENSNPTGFTRKDHTACVFTTDLAPEVTFWQ